MKPFLLSLLLAAVACAHASDQILILRGSAGSPDFEERFSLATDTWIELAHEAGASADVIGPSSFGENAKQGVQDWLASPARKSARAIWMVYLGHGTSNAGGAKLNLPGEDLTADELASWLAPVTTQLVFVHGGSASAPFLPKLSGSNRVIITATRSAAEQNYARFGELFAQALGNPRSDIDRDRRVSLLEAFLSASSAVETFYKEAGRLTTEHALLDDNGDSKGTPATLFSGLRLTTETGDSSGDGRLARILSLAPDAATTRLDPEQQAERSSLERELEALYLEKDDRDEDAYYGELESILNKLSKIYLGESDT